MGEIRRNDERQMDVLTLLREPATKAKLGQALARVGVTPDRMVSWAMTAIRRQPALQRCNPLSLLGAVIQSAQLGLDPSGVTGEAYLVPYKDEVTLIPGYRGLIALARRSGQVKEIMGHAVHKADVFEYEYGLDSKLRHVPSTDADPGPLTHVYAYAKFSGGTVEDGRAFVVLTLAEVEAVKARSRASRNGPWVSDFEAMAIKTAVRRLAKWLPLKPDEYRGFEIAEREERGLVDLAKDEYDVGEAGGDEIPDEQDDGPSLTTGDEAPDINKAPW